MLRTGKTWRGSGAEPEPSRVARVVVGVVGPLPVRPQRKVELQGAVLH